MTYERLCRREMRCVARQDHNGPAPTDRPICDRCAEDLSRVLREFGGRDGLLVQLRLASLATLAGKGLTERTAGGAVEAPLLFDPHIDELANTVVTTVIEWAGYVALIAGVPMPPPGHHLAGRALDIAIATLRPRLSVLLALQRRGVSRNGEPAEMDGGDGALELFELHHRCRAALGRTLKVLYLPVPCPTCRVKALCRYDGHEGVRCGSCGAETELDDHEPVEESA